MLWPLQLIGAAEIIYINGGGADKAVFASPGCVTLRGRGWAVAGVGMVSADRRDVRLFCQCPLALSEEGRCLL